MAPATGVESATGGQQGRCDLLAPSRLLPVQRLPGKAFGHPARVRTGWRLLRQRVRLNLIRRNLLRRRLLPDRQGGRISMPVPSSGSGTAVAGSALPSRNSRAIIATMGRMTSAKTNIASITRRLLTANRDSVFTSAKPVASTGAGASDAIVSTAGRGGPVCYKDILLLPNSGVHEGG